jgi:dTDP-4-dehydrorhamnose 3,5-epimerase
MTEKPPIHDLILRPLTAVREEGIVRWVALKEDDQLLRRFGEAEVVRLEPGYSTALTLRPVVDEVWALLEGAVEAHWHDLRAGSPTHGQRYRATLHRPTAFLAPFGVAFGVRALEGTALLARFATHMRGDPESAEDAILDWETGP